MVYLQTTYELRFSGADPRFVVRGGGGREQARGLGTA